MTSVYVTFDTAFATWNVMNENGNCEFYGTADELDLFLEENKQFNEVK